jgi:hypothetical protein
MGRGDQPTRKVWVVIMERHLLMVEDIVVDKLTEEAHEQVHFALQKLRQKNDIDFFINVPYEKRYQFFIYYIDNSKTGVAEIIKLFTDNKLFFRYKELM